MKSHHKPHRIAFFVGSFRPGGTEHYLVRLLTHLDRERYDPLVVTLDDSGPLRKRVYELAPVHPVRLANKLTNRQGRSELLRIARRLREDRCDLVHVLQDWASLYGMAAARLARIRALPVVASHRMSVHPPPGMGRAVAATYALSVRFLAAHVLPNSHAVADVLARYGVQRDRMTVVHNGISVDRMPPDAVPEPSGETYVICTVGGLRPEKGQQVAIEALSRLIQRGVPAKLRIVGQGNEAERLKRLAQSMDINDRIEWVGYSPNPMPDILGSNTCLLPSYTEGFPNVVVEYLAGGRAVVATNVGGVPEVISDGETGLLVPPGDPNGMADALERLYADRDFRMLLGERGRNHAVANLTAAREIEQTTAIYDRMLSVRGG